MGAFKLALKCICLIQNYVIAATALANAFIALGFISSYFLIFFPKIHQIYRILTFLNAQEEFIKKEIAGSSQSDFSLCDWLWSCLRARKSLDYPFCFLFLKWWVVFSSWMCSTLPFPWPMIIYFRWLIILLLSFFFFFLKVFSHLL